MVFINFMLTNGQMPFQHTLNQIYDPVDPMLQRWLQCWKAYILLLKLQQDHHQEQPLEADNLFQPAIKIIIYSKFELYKEYINFSFIWGFVGSILYSVLKLVLLPVKLYRNFEIFRNIEEIQKPVRNHMNLCKTSFLTT